MYDHVFITLSEESNGELVEELQRYGFHVRVIEISKSNYLILGRTERAFCTHPAEWIATERITNRIFSLELGKEADITAGSCAMSRRCAELILQHSRQVTTDAEWAMIIHRIGKLEVGYLAVEGLEYEEETNADTKHKTETGKWFARVKASYLISKSSIQTGREKEGDIIG